MSTIIRPARDADLPQIYDVFYENEVGDNPSPPPAGDIPSDLRHTFETGALYVAEREGRVLAFAGAITRGEVTFLTDLFVRPDRQSAGLGQALLQRTLPMDGSIRCTCSSTDPRALALYIRAGMQPQWPHVNLRLDGEPHATLMPMGIEVVEAQADDPELARWDTAIGGRQRPRDLAYWAQAQGATPLWFRRWGETVGYGYVRPAAGDLWDPAACALGPIGAATPQDTEACVLAAAAWARSHVMATVLRIDVPGPHSGLASLLEAGFRITYVETFLSTARTPFFDARRYVASGSNLL